MNIKRLSVAMPIFVAILVGLFGLRPAQQNPLDPQCGQYCVLRTAQLLGVPTTLAQVATMLPPKIQGESLLELKTVLERLGMQVEGWRAPEVAELNLDQLPCPFIAAYDDHFVVVDEVDGVLRIFDGEGRRSYLRPDEFRARWSGAGLEVHPPPMDVQGANNQPRIALDSLYLDAGEVQYGSGTIQFPVKVCNRGRQPLVIENILTSCACTSTVEQGKSILPGENSEFAIDFEPGTLLGPFLKHFVIQSNDPQRPLIEVSIAGNVIRELNVSHSRVNFGEVVLGAEPTVKRFYISHVGDQPLEIKEASVDIEGFTVNHQRAAPTIAESYERELVEYFPATAKPDRFVYGTNTLCVEVQVAPELALGEFRGQLRIVTNIEESMTMEVVGYAVNPITAHPGFLFLGGKLEEERMTFCVRDGRNYQPVASIHKQEGLQLEIVELRPGVFQGRIIACDLAHVPAFMKIPFRSNGDGGECLVTFPVWHPEGGFRVAGQ